MRRLGRARERLERAQGHGCRKGKGLGLRLLALHQRRLEAGELDRRAARHGQDQARLRRLDRRAVRRRRDRAGLLDHPGADASPRCWASTSSRIRIVTGDSDVVPKDNGSYSSRVTFMVGNAAIDAAQNLKGLLVAAAARKLDARPEDIECLGEVYRAGAQDKGATFEEVVTEALKDTGTITVTGNYSTIPESHGGKKYRGAAIGGTMGYSYSAQVVEVSVDEETGVVTVDKVWVAHDCGKALNRLTVEGQVQGSVWMGMGQAMSEETGYHDGLLVTGNMLDYRVPTIQDSPPIEVGIVESNDPHGPFGAKEAGEGSLAAFLPALTNAIADAIGVRFNDLPVTPDRVFAALEKRQRAAASRKRNGTAPDGRAAEFRSCVRCRRSACDEVAAAVARAPHPDSQLARRRHRSRRQHPPRHRRAAGADRHERRRRAARHQGRRADGIEIGAVGDAGRARRAPGMSRALSRSWREAAGVHRRADPSQHGHRRRQSLPRHALHLLQSERMVARRQQSLPQDHRRHLPRGAEEPRRVLRHLQRRSGARAADARRRGRSRRARGPAHAAAERALHRLCAPGRPVRTGRRQDVIWRCGPGEIVTAVRAKNTPGLRSAYDKIRIRRSIEYPVAGVAVALRREGDVLADLRVAFTGTNPRPVLLDGTAELCGGAARRARASRGSTSWCATRSWR